MMFYPGEVFKLWDLKINAKVNVNTDKAVQIYILDPSKKLKTKWIPHSILKPKGKDTWLLPEWFMAKWDNEMEEV